MWFIRFISQNTVVMTLLADKVASAFFGFAWENPLFGFFFCFRCAARNPCIINSYEPYAIEASISWTIFRFEIVSPIPRSFTLRSFISSSFQLLCGILIWTTWTNSYGPVWIHLSTISWLITKVQSSYTFQWAPS